MTETIYSLLFAPIRELNGSKALNVLYKTASVVTYASFSLCVCLLLQKTLNSFAHSLLQREIKLMDSPVVQWLPLSHYSKRILGLSLLGPFCAVLHVCFSRFHPVSSHSPKSCKLGQLATLTAHGCERECEKLFISVLTL